MFPLSKGTVSWFFLFFCLLYSIESGQSSETRVVCYYTNWSVYRPGTAKFNPQNINPYLCTHLIYAFGGFTKDNTLKPFDKYQDIEQGGYAKFTGLKTYNKELKTLLAIGGWNEASSRFSPLVANAGRRQKFVKSIIKFLRQNHFDGLDLDWEYPNFRDGGKPRDKDNYAQFVQELREEFDRESSKTGRPRLLVTMAVPAGIEYIEKGYDIPKLNKYLDWFNILTYDYHSAFEPSVNHHAPLKSLEEDDEYNFDSELNIDHTVKFYLTAGADRDKLVLGIPTYGRSYTLFNADANEIGAPADGPGDQGDATREKGYLAYYEICQNIKEDEWSVVQPNPDVMGPYAFKDTQWVGYDDEAMARKKGIYVAENGLGGIMFWSIDNDDFRGICGGKPYPIIEAAKEALLDSLGVGGNDIIKSTHAQRKPNRSRGRPNSSDRNRISKNKEKSDIESKHRSTTIASRGNSRRRKTTTTSTTTTTFKPYESLIPVQRTTPEPPTTPDPGSDFKCEDEGFFPHPRDCKKYFWCLDSGPSNLGIVAHQFTCPSGLFFNKAADSCDYSRNVLCKIKDISTVKPITTTTAATPPPSKVTFATSRTTLFRTTTTSTTPAYEEDEYEDDDEEEEEETNLPHRDIEDPRVIKELIDLIKKAGGLEELEKQLQFQEDGSAMLSNSKSREISTTPATISKSLYQKVLSRTAAGTFPPKNRYSQFFNRKDDKNKVDRSSEIALEKEVQTEEVRKNSDSKYSSVVRNSRPSPQNAGLDQLPEFEGFLKEKPKYVTIQRTKSTSTISPDDEDDDDENENEDESEEEEDDEEEDDVQQHRQRVRYSTPTSNLQYVNIRRQRPTTEINEKLDAILDEDDSDTANLKSNIESTQGPQYLSISRRRPTTTTETITTESDLASSSTPSNRYKFIERSRPTTTTDHSVTAIVEGSDVEYSQTSSSSSTSLSLSTSSQSLDSTTLVPSTNIKSTITTINPDNTRVYANFARRTTQQSQEKSTELPTTTSILYTTQKQIFDIVEFPETNIITTTNEPIIETETLIYNNINNNSNNDNNDDKTEVTTILGLTSNLSLITDNIVSNRDTTSKPLSIFTQTTTTTTKTELNSISLNNNNHNNSSSSNINNNNNSSINISHKISNTNNTNYNNSYETSTFGSNIQNDFSSTLLVPRPFGFSRRTRPATSTSTISTTNGVPQENPVSPSKVSSSLSFVELNRRKNLGVNKTSSLSRTITEVGNISSSDGDDDFNADNYSKSFLSRPKPFSVPLPIETVENKFKSRDRKRPLGSRVSQSPQPSPSSILPSEVNKVLTTSTDSASDISSATQRPRANVIRSRGRGRYQVPQITQGYNQVASTSHRPPSAPRPFRPALHQIDDNDSKIEETSQKNIVRPLRPKGFENDLSSLTAGDFSRLVGVNRRKSVRITRPPTTRASTTEEPDYIEDLIETENPIIRPLRPTGFESDLSSLTAADFSRGVNPSRKPLKVTRRPGIRRTTIRTTTKNTRNYVIQEEQKENKFNSQSEVRRPFSSRITPSFNVSEKNKSDEPRNSLSDKSLSINRFSSQSFRKGRLNLSSTEDLKEIKETINVTLQKIDKPNFQRRPFRPAAINSLANDEVASSIDILNLEKNPDSQFIPRQLNVSSRVNTINITAGNFRVFENISNINSQLASTNENDDQSTINNSVKVSLGRKINSGLESETDSTKNDHLTVTEIINELINFGTNISDVSNNEELDSSTDSNKIISSNENSTNNVKILSLVNSANQINSEAHENSLNENIENITETQNITENSNEIESTTIIDTIIESQTKKIGIEEEKKIQTLETTSKKNIIEEIKPIFFSNRTRLLQGLTSNSSLSDFLEITDDKLTIDSKKLLNHSSALPETSLKNSTAEEKLIINRRRPVNSSFNSRITNSTETDSVVKITNGTDVRKRIRPTRPSRISLISSTEDSLIIDEQSTKNTEETSRNSVRKRPGFSSRTTTIERQRIQKPENNYRSSTTELSINEDDSVDANGEVITTERVLNSTIRSKITFGSGRQRIQRPGFNIQKTAGESDNVTDSAIERDVNTASQKNESSNGRRRITFVNGSQGIKRPGFNRAKPLKESSKNEEISIDINKESTITEQTEDTTTSKIVFGSGRQRVKRPVFTTENPISTLTDDKDSSVNENDESTTTEPNENLTTRDNISFGNGRLRIKRPGFSTYETITDSSDIEGDPVDVIDETTVTEETGTLTTHRRKVFGNEKQRNQTPLNLITESSTDEDSSVDEITATEQIESLTSRNIVSFDTARQRNQNSRLKITESTTESSDIEDDSTATEQIDSLTTRSRIKFGNGRQRTQTPRFNTQNSVTESSDNEDDVSTATEQTDNITIRNRVVFGIGRQRTQRPKYNTQSTITESSDIENDYSTVTEQTEGYTTRSRIAFGRQQPGLDRLKLTTESSDNNDDTGDENEDITLTEFAKDTTIRSRISFGNRRQRPQRPGLNRLKLTTNSSDNNEDTGDENDKNAVTEGSKSTTIRSRISFANGRQRTQKPGLKTLKLTKEFSDNDDNAVDEIDEITATEDSKNGGSRVRIAFGSGRKINQRPELIRIRVTTESSDNNDDFVEENDELTTTDKQTKKTTNRTRINFGTARQRIQRPGFNVRKSSNPSNNEDDSIDEHENDSVTESVDNTRHKIAFGTNRKRIQRPGYKSRGSTTELSRNSNESIDGNEEEPPADQILKPITSNKNKFGIEKPAIRRPEFSPRVSTTESSNNINDSDDVNDETTEVEQTESSTTRRKIAFGIGRERFGLNSRISLNKSSIDDTFDRNIETDIVKPTIQSKIEFGKQRIQNLGLKYRKTTTATDKPIDEILDGNEEINDAVNNKTIHDELITEKTDGVLSSLNEIGVVQITGTHLVSNSSQNSTDFISIELDANNEKSISETTLGPRRRKVIRKKIMPTIAPENNFNISSIDEELSKSVNNFNISSIDEELSKSISSITLSPNNATSDIPRRRKIIRKVRPSKNLTENIATVEIVTQYNLNLESESSDNKTESEKKFESENVPDQIGKFNILSDGNAFEITEKEKTEKSEYDGSVNETKKVSGKDRVSKSQILTGSNINLLEDEAEIYNNNENRTKVRLNRTHLNRTEFISSKLESKNTDRDNKKLLNIINKTRVDRVRPVGLKINRAIGNQSIPSLNTLEQDERKTTFGLEYEDETAVEDDGSKPKIQIKTSNFKLNHTKFNKTLINATNKNVTAKDTIGKVAIRLSEENKISLEVENETSKTNTSTAGGFELNHTNFNHTSFSGLNISTSKEENAVIENEGLLTSNESEETNISSIKHIGFSINQTHHNQTVILKETVIHDEESEYEESDEVKNTKINRIRPDGFKLHSIQFNSTTNITEQNTFNENDGPVKLTDEHSKSYRIGLGGHQFNQTQSNFTEISAKNITNHESISKSDKNMELEELVVDSEEQNIVTDIPSLTSSTIIPHRNRLIGINRPSFKPRRPSSSEVISSTESSSTTSKNYVRKFSNRFSLGRKPEEIVASEENVGLFDPNPIVIRPVRPEIRPLRPNFGISRYNVDEYEESEERFSDEEEEESIEEEVFKSVVRKPSFNHLNRNRFGTNQNSRVEDDESIEERPNGRPNYQGYNNRYNPNRFQTEEKEESDNSSYESEEEYNNNYKEKSETARPIFRYTAPPRLPQPRPSFRTIGSATTTIHPASLKFKLTPVDSTTQSIRELELIKSRNYERKYFPSTTDINNVQPNLLEELDVNAINARNKKIFNEHKKFTTTTTQRINNITEDSNVQQTLDSLTIIPDTPPTTTTDEQYDVTTTDSNTIITTTIIQDSDDSYTSTQKMELTDIIDEKEVFNTNIILQETGTTELSSTKRTKLTTTTTQKPTTLHHIFAIDEDSSIDNIRDRLQSSGESSEQISKKLEKLVEINRIVEVYSKQEKIRNINDTDNTESFNWVLEKVPTLDKLGEISRIILIRLQNHNKTESEQFTGYEKIDQFLDTINKINKTSRSNTTTVTNVSSKNPENNLIIDSKSSFADYSPTEYPSTSPLTPVRNIIPVETTIDGEDNLIETIYSTVERPDNMIVNSNLESTIKLNNNDNVKRHEVLPLEGKKSRNIYFADMVESVETSTIPLEGLFHREREAKETSFSEDKEIPLINSILTTTPVYYNRDESSSVSGLLDIIKPPSKSNDQEISAKQLTSPVFISDPHYVRPLAPFLRPESNESSPLVISIANLDQVILSKVEKTNKTKFFNHPERAQIKSNVGIATHELNIDHTANIKPAIITDADINSEELRTLKKRAKDDKQIDFNDNPPLSIIQEQTNSENKSSKIQNFKPAKVSSTL